MKDLYAFTEFRLQMINVLDKLLHPLEGVLEQGDEVSQLHDGGVAPPLLPRRCA